MCRRLCSRHDANRVWACASACVSGRAVGRLGPAVRSRSLLATGMHGHACLHRSQRSLPALGVAGNVGVVVEEEISSGCGMWLGSHLRLGSVRRVLWRRLVMVSSFAAVSVDVPGRRGEMA